MKGRKTVFSAVFLTVLLLIVWMGLMGVILYCGRGMSLRLLWIDMKGGVRYAPGKEHLAVAAVFFGAVAVILCWLISKKGLFRLIWDVRIGNKQMKIDSHKLPCIRLMVLICLSFLILFAVMLRRDSLAHRKGGRLTDVLIEHAFGGIDDITYTNSKEALIYNYDLGHRAFEVDFAITADDKLICLHDWTDAANMQGRKEATVLSKEEYESTPLWEKYTPISVDELLLFMSEHEDVWIVTDSKETAADLAAFEFTYIVNEARALGVEKVLDRISVQVYNPEMYDVVCGIYKFPSFIFTLYQYWDESVDTFPDICRFCAYNDIDIITMWYHLATPEIMKIANLYGIKIYVHTVNDMATVNDLRAVGVTGFYTDFLTLEELQMIE